MPGSGKLANLVLMTITTGVEAPGPHDVWVEVSEDPGEDMEQEDKIQLFVYKREELPPGQFVNSGNNI